eukprot:871200-Heterocapsa_arctica.AAC.1
MMRSKNSCRGGPGAHASMISRSRGARPGLATMRNTPRRSGETAREDADAEEVCHRAMAPGFAGTPQVRSVPRTIRRTAGTCHAFPS